MESCSVLQCLIVCCSVLQCVAVWCSVLQCLIVCCSCVLQFVVVAVRCSVLQCVAEWCSVACCSVLQLRTKRIEAQIRTEPVKPVDGVLLDSEVRMVYIRRWCVTWLIHMCDMTHSHLWHDSFTCVTWLIHMCDVTHSCAWRDAFTCVTWLIQMCDVPHPDESVDDFFLDSEVQMVYIQRWSFKCVPFKCVTWLMSHIWMSQVTHMNESCTHYTFDWYTYHSNV